MHVAVAVAYAGTGTPGAATLALYLWDPEQTQSWFVVAPVTLSIGEVTQVDVPVVMSALAQVWTVSVVLSVASPAAGTYAVAVGLSESATTSSVVRGAGDATAANQLLDLAQETVSAGTVGTPGATAPGTAEQVAGVDASGKTRVVRTDATGDVEVVDALSAGDGPTALGMMWGNGGTSGNYYSAFQGLMPFFAGFNVEHTPAEIGLNAASLAAHFSLVL